MPFLVNRVPLLVCLKKITKLYRQPEPEFPNPAKEIFGSRSRSRSKIGRYQTPDKKKLNELNQIILENMRTYQENIYFKMY